MLCSNLFVSGGQPHQLPLLFVSLLLVGARPHPHHPHCPCLGEGWKCNRFPVQAFKPRGLSWRENNGYIVVTGISRTSNCISEFRNRNSDQFHHILSCFLPFNSLPLSSPGFSLLSQESTAAPAVPSDGSTITPTKRSYTLRVSTPSPFPGGDWFVQTYQMSLQHDRLCQEREARR